MILSTASTLSVETTLRSFSTPSTMTIFTTVVMRPAFPSWTTFSLPFSRSALSRRTVLYGTTSTFVSSFSTTLDSGLDGSTGAAGSFVPTSMILSTASTLSVETTLRSFSTPSTITIFTTVVMLPAFPSWTTFSLPFSRSALSRRTVLYGTTSTLVSSFSTTLDSGLDGSTGLAGSAGLDGSAGAAGSFVPTSIISSTASTLLVETTLRSVSLPSTITTCSTVVTLPSLPF